MSILKEEYGLAAILAGLCVLGVVFLGAEWIIMERSAEKLRAKLNAPADSALEPERLSADDFLMKPKQAYSQQVERPLFVQGRRPIPDQPVDDDTPFVAPVKLGKLNVKLMGVIDVPSGRKALIYDIKNRTYLSLKEGEAVDGWRLTALSPGKAVLRQGMTTEEILLRKPKPKNLPRRARKKKAPRRPAIKKAGRK